MFHSLILLATLLGASALSLKHIKQNIKPKLKNTEEVGKTVGGRTAADRAALPHFLVKQQNVGDADEKGFSWSRYRWNLDSPGLSNHPARVKDLKENHQFEIVCCMGQKNLNHFEKLPKRTPENPYLVKVLGASEGVQKVFATRTDFLALNYDLRDEMDKSHAPLRGITIAPHNYYNGRKAAIDAPREFFVTFQGRKTSKLRHELHDAFNNHRMYKLWRNISVETVMDRNWNQQQQVGDAKFNKKMNSTYVLLPKGDDRWSLRFAETIGAGAIPVILADGLTLPYENTIDWSKAAIRLPNKYAENADEIMKRLPSDKPTIMKMREAVYDINRKYFATPDARADAMLMEAAAEVKKGGAYKPIWRPEEAEPWLEANSQIATPESKVVALKLLAEKFKEEPIKGYLKATNKTKTLVTRN